MFYETDPHVQMVNEDLSDMFYGGYVSDRTWRLAQKYMLMVEGVMSEPDEEDEYEYIAA